MIYPILLFVLSLAAAIAVIFRRGAEASCAALLARLYPSQLSGLDALLDGAYGQTAVWRDSHGLAGLYKRWRNRSVFVKLLQLEGERLGADAKDVAYLLEHATQQTWSSLAAVFFACLSPFGSERSARRLVESIGCYRAVALHTHSLLAEADSPLCAKKLASIL